MKLHKSTFSIRHAIGNQASRYPIAAMQVFNGRAQSTDGSIAFDVELADTTPEDFPIVEGVEPTEEPIALDKKTANAIVKSIPKNTGLPVLDNALIGKSGDKAVVATTDLASRQVFGTEPAANGNWPTFDVIAPKGEPQAHTFIGVDYLIMLGKTLKEFHGTADASVRVELREEGDVITFTTENDQGQKLTAYLMPSRS